MSDTFTIKLPVFEGPFDLLLFFIERDELDIYNIPIAKITDDFLDYLRHLESVNVDLAAEFIVVAATLMRIKAKMLLPRKQTDDEGNEIIKEIIKEGEIFGQFALERNNLNGEFAKAYKGNVSLCAFSIEDFEKLLKKKPELAIKYSKQVGEKLRRAEFRLLNMLNKDVRARLLAFYYHLAIMDGYNGSATSYSIDNFLTQDDIAKLIGSARQTDTTLINQLEGEGLVKISRKKIEIPDVKKLQQLVMVT